MENELIDIQNLQRCCEPEPCGCDHLPAHNHHHYIIDDNCHCNDAMHHYNPHHHHHECPPFPYWGHHKIVATIDPPHDKTCFWLRYVVVGEPEEGRGEFELFVWDIPEHRWRSLYDTNLKDIADTIKNLVSEVDDLEEKVGMTYSLELNKDDEGNDRICLLANDEIISSVTLPSSNLQFVGHGGIEVTQENNVVTISGGADIDFVQSGDIVITQTDDLVKIHSLVKAGNNLTKATDEGGDVTLAAPEYIGKGGIVIEEDAAAEDGHKIYNVKLNDKPYVYKGSVVDFNELRKLTNQSIGDVWNVETAGDYEEQHYEANTNFAWNGSKWDSLGGIVKYPELKINEPEDPKAFVTKIKKVAGESNTFTYETADIEVPDIDTSKFSFILSEVENGVKIGLFYAGLEIEGCEFTIKGE